MGKKLPIIDSKQRNEAKQIFIKRLKEIRDDNKLKNKDFAEFLGISEKELRSLLKGKYSPRLDTLVLISKKVKVTVAYLLGEDETQLYKDETKSIAEYTGLSEKAFNNLHFIKLLNERHGAFPNDHDEEKSHGEKKPFFIISMLFYPIPVLLMLTLLMSILNTIVKFLNNYEKLNWFIKKLMKEKTKWKRIIMGMKQYWMSTIWCLT